MKFNIEFKTIKKIDESYYGTFIFYNNNEEFLKQDDFINLIITSLTDSIVNNNAEQTISFCDSPVFIKIKLVPEDKISLCFFAEHSMGTIALSKEIIIDKVEWIREVNKLNEQYKEIIG